MNRNGRSEFDLIVVGGYQKRKLHSMMTALRGYSPKDTVYSDLVSVYESDFGVCKIIASRWVPQDMVLMLDSSRVNVLPLGGRSFHFKPLSSSGDCGSLDNPYGPFDYTNVTHRAEKLPRVEKAHFDTGVRNLKGHRRKVFTWNSLVGDIDYTLRTFPNHHDALYAMVQYALRGYNANYPSQYTPECWFDRAKRFNRDDGNVWLIESVAPYSKVIAEPPTHLVRQRRTAAQHERPLQWDI